MFETHSTKIGLESVHVYLSTDSILISICIEKKRNNNDNQTNVEFLKQLCHCHKFFQQINSGTKLVKYIITFAIIKQQRHQFEKHENHVLMYIIKVDLLNSKLFVMKWQLQSSMQWMNFFLQSIFVILLLLAGQFTNTIKFTHQTGHIGIIAKF